MLPVYHPGTDRCMLPGYHPYQVHLGLRSGATATLVNGRVSSSYEHRLGEQVGSRNQLRSSVSRRAERYTVR